MKICTATLESISALCQSRMHNTPKLNKEKPDEYEHRTWREKMHVDGDGFVFIPPMAFKFAIEKAASMLRIRIPGKGQSEYGKHFKSGVLVVEGLTLPVKKEQVDGQWLNLHANGKRGSGSRVQRCIPTIPKWSGDVQFFVVDDTIDEPIFEQHLKEAGSLVGIGQFRPENGGYCGRFKVVKTAWQKQ